MLSGPILNTFRVFRILPGFSGLADFTFQVAAPAGGRKTRQTRRLQIFTSARSARSKNLEVYFMN